MPTATIKSYAKKSGKSVKKVEEYWEDAKKAALDKGIPEDSDNFWAYVNAIVKRRCGLDTEVEEGLKIIIKELLEEEFTNFVSKKEATYEIN